MNTTQTTLILLPLPLLIPLIIFLYASTSLVVLAIITLLLHFFVAAVISVPAAILSLFNRRKPSFFASPIPDDVIARIGPPT